MKFGTPEEAARAKYLFNIASYLNKGAGPGMLAKDMAEYGVTADDLIAARSMFPGSSAPPAPAKRAGGIVGMAEGGAAEAPNASGLSAIANANAMQTSNVMQPANAMQVVANTADSRTNKLGGNFAILGDSLSSTLGYDASGNPIGNLNDVFGNDFANISRGGMTTTEALTGKKPDALAGNTENSAFSNVGGTFQSFLESSHPSTVLLRYGAADAAILKDPTQTLNNLETMVQMSNKAGSKPVLVGIPPVVTSNDPRHGGLYGDYFDFMPPLVQQINDGMKSLADKYGLQYIDLSNVQIPKGGLLDGLHPNAETGTLIANEIKNQLGAMKKYSFKDFGLTPATEKGVFSYRQNVMYNPTLEAMEAIERARLKGNPELAENIYRALLGRQRRTNVGELNYAEGGDVGRGLGSIAMKGYAEELRRQGRNGDTMLAHINPQEAQMLEMMGGSGTINPATGLPEYGFSWKKLLKAAQFIIPFIPGIGLPLKIALSGIAGGISGPGKGFDFKRGLISGALTFAGGKLAEGLAAAGQAGANAGSQVAADTASRITDPNLMAGNVGTSVMLPGGGPSAALNTYPSIMLDPAAEAAKQYTMAGMQIPLASEASYLPTAPQGQFGQIKTGFENAYKGTENLISGTPGASEAFKQAAGYSPSTLGGGMVAGYGALESADESTKFELQQAIANAKTEEEREKYRQLFLRIFPSGYAGGGMTGLSALAAGGATGPANMPRTINGTGDGMSDSVPATIEGIQEARLADGEFVIPADVVADLGNGSSNAGSKKLYAMMDRVRQSRHGTTRQPPEVNMNRLMPV